MPSSSYGSSFSEKVNIIGNQIQIAAECDDELERRENLMIRDDDAEPNAVDVDPLVPTPLSSSGSKFCLKFSERELKE